MPFHDSDSETQVQFSETDITGSNSNKAAVLMAGVTPSNTASFLKVSESGELIVSGAFSADVSIAQVDQGNAGAQDEGWYARLTDGTQVLGTGSSAPLYTSGSVYVENFPSIQTITGSVGITQAPPLTIGSFNTTASISIEEANVIFDVTGTVGVTSIASPVTIGNFPAVQTITGSVVLGEQPIETTGTLGITELPNVTIDSFITTASVSLAETLVTQSVVGDVSVNNFPAVQTVTGSVTLGEQPINITGSVILGEQPINATGSITVNSVGSPIKQGIAGTQEEGWFVRITDGTQVLGTGSGAPFHITGSVRVDSVSSPTVVSQGQSGNLTDGWFTRITDGNQVLGTGSSAPIYTSGSVHVQNFPPVQTITGSIIVGEQPIKSVLSTADGSSLNLTQSAPILSDTAGFIVGGKDLEGLFQFLTVDRSNRLQVSFTTEAPVGTTAVFVGTSSVVPGTSETNTDYTIPSGSTLVLQRLAGGSEGQPDRTSRVDLFYYPSGTTGPGELLRNGFCSSNNFEFTLNFTFEGDGTKVIRLIRARMDGGARQITGFWDGFLE